MSLYNGPARGGTRGGKDQFSWEGVKADKDREFYLGHSVKATTGRWQKHKDVFWYTREKGDSSDPVAEELRRVKEREEDLMLEALGMKPPERRGSGGNRLTAQDLQQITQQAEGENDPNEDRVKGLGYNPTGVVGQVAHTEVLQGTAPVQLPGPPSRPAGKPGPSAALSKTENKAIRKAEKKQAKQAKKDAKHARREAKAAR